MPIMPIMPAMRIVVAVAVGAAIVAASSHPARAQATIEEIGSAIVVNEYTTGVQRRSVIAGSDSGAFVVVWESEDQDGDDFGIFARLFDSDGLPTSGEFQVNTYTTGGQTIPDVAMDPAGTGFVVVWSSTDFGGGAHQDGDLGGVFARVFDADGNPAGDEFQVNTYTTGGQGSPAVIAQRPTVAPALRADGNQADASWAVQFLYTGDGPPLDAEQPESSPVALAWSRTATIAPDLQMLIDTFEREIGPIDQAYNALRAALAPAGPNDAFTQVGVDTGIGLSLQYHHRRWDNLSLTGITTSDELNHTPSDAGDRYPVALTANANRYAWSAFAFIPEGGGAPQPRGLVMDHEWNSHVEQPLFDDSTGIVEFDVTSGRDFAMAIGRFSIEGSEFLRGSCWNDRYERVDDGVDIPLSAGGDNDFSMMSAYAMLREDDERVFMVGYASPVDPPLKAETDAAEGRVRPAIAVTDSDLKLRRYRSECIPLATTTTLPGASTTTTMMSTASTTTMAPTSSTSTTTTMPDEEPCGKALPGQPITASTALAALQASIGLIQCDLCRCDVDNSGGVTASDALRILRIAVNLPGNLDCPACD